MAQVPVCFYYRNGCHLCEELAAMLFRDWPEIADCVQWRDVDSSADWQEAFGLRIPVLTRGNEVICELKPDPDCLVRYFGAAGKSV